MDGMKILKALGEELHSLNYEMALNAMAGAEVFPLMEPKETHGNKKQITITITGDGYDIHNQEDQEETEEV